MAVIVTRITNPTGGTAKGSPLTSVEIDANFNKINDAKAEYPTQTGNADKYLQTNGSTASWVTVQALPSQTSHTGQYLTSDGTNASWALLGNAATVTTNANLTGGVTSVGNAATVVTNANLTGDVTSTGNATTVVKINGTTLSGLATGILKNTTSTGVPSIAIAADFPTLNQNTSGSAGSLSSTLAVASGGTSLATLTVNNLLVGAGTSAPTFIAPSTTGNVLTSNGTTWVSSAAGGGFPAGTRMSFQQTAAPTGWTKDTTAAIDGSALRFVIGTVGSGGTVAFTTAFSSQAVAGTNGTSGATTLSTSQMPSHSHTVVGNSSGAQAIAATAAAGGVNYVCGGYGDPEYLVTNSQGSGTSHTHPAATFTGTAINLAVKYYDFIIASKN